MPVLEKERLATTHIQGWRNTTPSQFVEELASLSQETHRIPDPYRYLITANEELFSPTAHCLIKDTVTDRNSHLGQMEYQAVIAIEQWAGKSGEGAIVWISPPYQGRYDKAAIVISEIEYQSGSKTLLNRKIVSDFDEKDCMKLAWNMTSFSQNKPIFTSLDQVRVTPLVLDTKDKTWINILEGQIKDPVLWMKIKNGEDERTKKEALRRAAMVQKHFFTAPESSYSPEARIAVMEMIGPHGGSCPPKSGSSGKTALQVFSENSLTFVGSVSKDPDFCKSCPVCGKEINCIVKAGGSCPECRAVKRCG